MNPEPQTHIPMQIQMHIDDAQDQDILMMYRVTVLYQKETSIDR